MPPARRAATPPFTPTGEDARSPAAVAVVTSSRRETFRRRA